MAWEFDADTAESVRDWGIAGGVIGSSVAPGVGTVVGGAIGGGLGIVVDIYRQSDDPEEIAKTTARAADDAEALALEWGDREGLTAEETQQAAAESKAAIWRYSLQLSGDKGDPEGSRPGELSATLASGLAAIEDLGGDYADMFERLYLVALQQVQERQQLAAAAGHQAAGAIETAIPGAAPTIPGAGIPGPIVPNGNPPPAPTPSRWPLWVAAAVLAGLVALALIKRRRSK